MADQKISQLNSLTGANTASGDLVTIVDISDTTMGASGTNKKMTLTEFQASPVSAGTANGVTYLNASKVLTSGSALTFDGTNLGVGVTPSAWESTCRMLQLGAIGTVGRANSGQTQLGFNYFINSSGQYVYIQSLHATRHEQVSGEHRWFNAASGTAGNAITFTQAMTLDASGNLGIGTTSPGVRLDVAGATRIRAGNAIFFQNSAADNNATISCTGGSGNNTMSFNSGAMTLDGSGNLGLGVTPSAWATLKGFDISSGGALFGYTAQVGLANNAYFDGSGWRYKNTDFAAFFRANALGFEWHLAPSGTAGNAITFTQAMTLGGSGNLGLNTSTFGTSAAGVLSLGTGTAPTTGPADTVQLFSVDRSAGNTIPAVRCEGSGVTNAGITNTTVTTKIAMQVNGTIYYLLATTNAT
jgi:hypothetical protein